MKFVQRDEEPSNTFPFLLLISTSWIKRSLPRSKTEHQNNVQDISSPLYKHSPKTMVQPMRRDPHAQTRPQMAQFATDLYEQTTTLNNAFTAGAPIQNQIEDDLARILERATEMSPHNTVALEINVQNALHLVRSRWNELVAAGRMSKRRYQHAAFDAVGKFEHAESEQELRDYVERLKQQTSDLDIMIATTGGDDILTARYDSLKVDLRKAEKRLRALVFDVRFLTARTLIDRLEAAPWGVNPDEETANGASEHDLTNSTLKRFNAAMKTLMDRIDNRYGPADWSTDVTSEVSLVEDDETRKKTFHARRTLDIADILRRSSERRTSAEMVAR